MDHDLIEGDRSVMMGKPVIVGTRITVESILERLGGGQTVDEILEAQPRLTREAIRAAVEFAIESVRLTAVYPVSEGPA